MRLTIALGGEAQLDRTLLRITQRIDDWSPAFDAIADQLAQENRAQFNSEGRHGSGGWPALSPAYRAWKEKNYPGKPILQRTGRLFKAMTERPFSTEQIGVQSMTIGVGDEIPYAEFHQTGTKKMPRRRPLELTAVARNRMTKTMQRYAMTGSVEGA